MHAIQLPQFVINVLMKVGYCDCVLWNPCHIIKKQYSKYFLEVLGDQSAWVDYGWVLLVLLYVGAGFEL